MIQFDVQVVPPGEESEQHPGRVNHWRAQVSGEGIVESVIIEHGGGPWNAAKEVAMIVGRMAEIRTTPDEDED
jgi:hypothetical protein